MSDVGLTHVALPVTNLDASLAFYARYAAMRVVHRRKGAAWISDTTRPFVIVLLEMEEVAHPLRPMAHLGVGCESRERVEELCAEAEREGDLMTGPHDTGPPVGFWAFLRDPDGHTLEIAHGQEVALTVERAQGAEGD